jgi:hypothetical protein
MAENKKGFILYCDLIHTVEQLPNEKAGELFKHILRYVNDLNPQTDDLVTKITFEPIRQQLKRDLTKWTEKSIKRSEAGRLGGLKSGEVRKQNEANEANALNSKQNEQVIDTVKVTDTVIVKEEKKKEIKKQPIFDFSFVANNYQEVFKMWVDYKSEINDSYKTQRGLEIAYKQLLKFSYGNPQKAVEVVEYSIGNNWKGLFELKPTQQRYEQPNASTKQPLKVNPYL